MQNLKLILVTILVAGCLLHVDGFPKRSGKPKCFPTTNRHKRFEKLLPLGREMIDTILEKVDLTDILTELLINQSGELMKYENIIEFLQKLSEILPSLKKAAGSVKIVSYFIKQIKGKKNIDPANVMKKALDVFSKEVDPVIKKKLIELAPLVVKAARGDKNAAKQIVSSLVNREMIVKAIKGIGSDGQIKTMKSVANLLIGHPVLYKTAPPFIKLIALDRYLPT